MAKFKIIFSLLFLTGCGFGIEDETPPSSCDNPNPSSYEGGQIHFEVGKFDLKIIYPSESGGTIQPNSFILEFRAPITVINTKQPMTGAVFQVHTFENYNKIDRLKKEICGDDLESQECVSFEAQRCDDQSLGGCTRIRTGADGYIYWQEKYHYPFPVTLEWIRFERVIFNLGGQVVIPFAVNPWLEDVASESKFLDLTKNNLELFLQKGQTLYKHDEEHELGDKDQGNLNITEVEQQCKNRRSLDKIFKDLKQSGEPLPVHVPSVNIEIASILQSEPNTFSININNIPIKLLSQSYSGSIVHERDALSGAKFKVTPLLLSQKGNGGDKESYSLLHRVTDSLTQIRDVKTGEGGLNYEGKIIISNLSNTDHMTLALKIEPYDKESRIKTFYGLYDIQMPSAQLTGVNTQLDLKTSLPGDEEQLQSMQDRLKDHKEVFENLIKEPIMFEGGFSTEDVSLTLNRIRFIRVKSSGDKCETPVFREVIYNIPFSVTNPQSQDEPYRRTSVAVSIEDMVKGEDGNFVIRSCPEEEECKTTISPKTDDSGNAVVPYTMTHFPYNLQKYLLKRITFQAPEKDKSFHSSNEQYVVLNPWEYGFLTYQNVTHIYKGRKEALTSMLDKCTKIKPPPGYCKEKKLKSMLAQCEEDSPPEYCEDENFKAFQGLDNQLNSIISSENLEPPRLRINEYRSSIIEPSYVIGSSLDITTVKNIQLLIQPSIVRTDSIGETIRQIPNVLPVGYWIMRVILAKGPQEVEHATIVRPIDSFFKMFEPSSWLGVMYKINLLSERIKDGAYPLESPDDRKDLLGKLINFKKEYSKLFSGTTDNSSQYPAPNFKKDDYISHYDLVVKGENTVVSSFLKQGIRTDQFRHLGSKNSLIIEIYPVDNRGLRWPDNSCELDKDRSKFAVMKQCKRGQNQKDDCHDLEAPAHWGLFTPSEVSSSHILWPMTDFDSSKVFDITPLPECLDSDCNLTNKSSLQLPSDNLYYDLFNIEKVNERFYPRTSEDDVNSTVDRKYTSILNKFAIVDDNDHLNEEKYKGFCEEVENKFLKDGGIDKRNILAEGSKKAVGNHIWDLCICDSNLDSISGLDKNQGSRFLKEKIKQCKLLSHLGLQRGLQKELQKELQRKDETPEVNINEDICQPRFTRTYTQGSHSDYSPTFHSYRECVCDPNSLGDDKTERMARCFAEREGLAYASTHTFLSNLGSFIDGYNNNNRRDQNQLDTSELLPLYSYEDYISSEVLTLKEKQTVQFAPVETDDISSMVKEGFTDVQKNFDKRSFLHAMCYYWFEGYYNAYVKKDVIQDFYKYHVKNLAYLENTHVDLAQHSDLTSSFEDLAQHSDLTSSFEDLAEQSEKLYKALDFDKKVGNISIPFGTPKVDRSHPVWKCLKNPMLFFHIERKVMVGQLNQGEDNKTKYKNGRVYTYIHSSAQGISSQYGFGSRESRQTKVGVGLGVGTGLATLLSIFRGGVDANASVNAETTDSEESSSVHRGQQDESKSITLAVNHISVDIDLKLHRSCLVIRPKSSAFEDMSEAIFSEDLRLEDDASPDENVKKLLRRWPYQTLGLMICAPEDETSMVVPEDYYYIHQFFGGHLYEFMSRTIYHNRPFVEIIRGQHIMDRFTYLANRSAHNVYMNTSTPSNNYGEVFQNLLVDRPKVDRTLIPAFEESTLDRSGFYNGIYTYNAYGDEYYDPNLSEAQIAQNEKRNEDGEGWLTDKILNFAALIRDFVGQADDRRNQ